MQFRPTLHKLSNGVTVILDPMDLETVAVKIRFNTGSRDETPDVYGITHFCEHMLVKGTKKFPTRKELKDFVEYNGGTFNASTSDAFLRIYGRIIAENTDKLLSVFADILQNSVFDEHKIDIERNVILDELRRARGNNSRKFADLIYTNLLGFSAYRTLGTDENIKSFTKNQMMEWLHQRLSAKNCIIGISGRIDNKDELLQKLESLFAFLPTHDVTNNTELKYTPCDKFLPGVGLKNVWLNILFPYIRPDTYENMRDNLAESKFRKYLVQELGEVVRQQNGLVYGLGMAGYGNEYWGVRGIDTETSPENLERAVALIAKTAYRVCNIDKITQPVVTRFYNIHKLVDADFLESATRRCDVLIGHYGDFGKLYDLEMVQNFDKSITADEVIKCSNGFFGGQMSIMTFGAEYGNIDLRKIWIDNFK